MFHNLTLGRRFLKTFGDKPSVFYMVDCNGHIVHGTAPFLFYEDGSKSWSSLSTGFRHAMAPRVTMTGFPFNLGMINGAEENAFVKEFTDDYSTIIILKE